MQLDEITGKQALLHHIRQADLHQNYILCMCSVATGPVTLPYGSAENSRGNSCRRDQATPGLQATITANTTPTPPPPPPRVCLNALTIGSPGLSSNFSGSKCHRREPSTPERAGGSGGGLLALPKLIAGEADTRCSLPSRRCRVIPVNGEIRWFGAGFIEPL